MVHLLDIYGADMSSGAGKFKFTPLMSATRRWNVRIVDYLIERGVNPFVQDSFGFTASRKAQMKNLNTIGGMLRQYESQYVEKKLPPVFSQDKKWVDLFHKIDFTKYSQIELWKKENSDLSEFKPSDVLSIHGEYPFGNMEENQDIFCIFAGMSGNNVYTCSDDHCLAA